MAGMESYNLFLYHQRQARGMSMRAFAGLLGIGWFRYRLIENGYIKPSPKDIGAISEALELDYEPYTTGKYSYPGEKEEPEKHIWLFRVIESRIFRCIMLALFLASLCFLIPSVVNYSRYSSNRQSFFSEDHRALSEALIDKGTTLLSIKESMLRPSVCRTEEDKYILLAGEYNTDRTGDFGFSKTFWTDETRITIEAVNVKGENDILFYADISEYDTGNDFFCTFSEGTEPAGREEAKRYKDILHTYAEDFFRDFDLLVKDKLDLNLSTESVFREIITVDGEIEKGKLASEITLFISMTAGLLTMFAFLYSVVYGKRRGEYRDFSRRISIGYAGRKELRSDIRVFPFIPETVFEMIGIVMLAFASLRYQIYLELAFVPGLGFSIADIKSMYDFFMQIFYGGMFLLYFIDFDLFMDDRRVIRNIIAYFFVFIGVYVIEQLFLGMLNSDSVVFSVIETKLPNFFGSITMYFLIMYLLFFTPKFINTKKKLIVFRCLSVIPVLVIVGTYLVFNGANTSFGWNLPDWALYLFSSERIPFSMLCVTYLYSVYFLRLHFIRKYGEETAVNYFNGNRFLFLKNIVICVIVVILSGIDYFLSKKTWAKQWGFGYMYYTMLMIPLLLFYHPHKGPRNRFVDYAILILYFLAFTGILTFLVQML